MNEKTKELLGLVRKLVELRVNFTKEEIDRYVILDTKSKEFKDEFQNLTNIWEYKLNKCSLNSLYRDLIEHSEIDKEIIKELTVKYSIVEKSKNPKNYQKYYIYEITHPDSTNPPIYYLLIPSLVNKSLNYCSYIHYNKNSFIVWGEGITKYKLKTNNFKILKEYLKK